MKTVDQMIADIIQREGGFNDLPNDRGGPTKFGISLKYLRGKAPNATREDIEHLTTTQAATFYRQDFFIAPRIASLDARLHPVMFDMAVNHGAHKAVTLLQQAIGDVTGRPLPLDGAIGPQTEARVSSALTNYGFPAVEDAVVKVREDFYSAIVAGDPSQAQFRNGWMHRAEEFRV